MVVTHCLKRIIPTRMGTSDDNSVFASGNEDHPHAYGDKVTLFLCVNTIG